MAERPAMAVWRTRLRWRLSGAWQWPTFAVLTVVDAVILARLPFSGGRANLLGCLLAAGLLNVIVVAVAVHQSVAGSSAAAGRISRARSRPTGRGRSGWSGCS